MIVQWCAYCGDLFTDAIIAEILRSKRLLSIFSSGT